MKLEWSEDLAIGNALIDAEHHFFLDLIRNISYSVEGEAHSDFIMRLLTELEKYAEFHFYSEENVMISCGYPDLEHHQQHHRQLLSQLADQIELYRVGATEAADVLDFLIGWFVMHTTHEDKKIAEFIRTELEKGCPDFLASGYGM